MIHVHVVQERSLRSAMEHSSRKTIFLIRHGETTGDLENRWGGAYNDHLTIQGEKEAEVLAQKLAQKNLECIITGSLFRAQETGTIINRSNLPTSIDSRFNERDGLMQLTGMRKDEAAKLYPELVALLKDHTGVIPGGETYEEFSKRIQDALYDVAMHSPYSRIAIVSHGGPMSVLFRDILRKGEITYQNCSFVEISFDAGIFSLVHTEGVTVIS
jgi:broad specificity phosphatase PhoE